MAKYKVCLSGNLSCFIIDRDGYLSPMRHCSEAFNNLLSCLVHPSPLERPTAADLESHPLICSSSDKSKV